MNRNVACAAILTATVGALVFACASPIGDDVLLVANDADAGGAISPPIFVAPDASDAQADVDQNVNLTPYCPSNECPEGRATCQSSRFRCEVNLRTDRANCGACGAACPNDTFTEIYECVEGKCEFECKKPYGDCDGVADNGCETRLDSNDNCNGCGVKCEDPTKPCVQHRVGYGCGCEDGKVYCPATNNCVDPKNDDDNCGACGNRCDPTGGGKPAYTNMYYGCVDSKCDELKCKKDWGNCDGLLSNGCETYLVTSANCGACGAACGAEEKCRIDPQGEGFPFYFSKPQCMCPQGMTFCGSCQEDGCRGQCFDLSSSWENCGACGLRCPAPPFFGATGGSTCNYGMCELQCFEGRADCNGDAKDYCETNIDSDPMNCGACGRVCDAIAGQACVGGECVVEPCKEEDAGVFTQ